MIVFILSVSLAFLMVLSFLKTALPGIISHRNAVNAVGDVSCEKRHWLFGHARYITPNEIGVQRNFEVMKTLPKTTLRWFGPFMFYLMGFHPDFTKTLLSSDAPKDDLSYKFLRPWLGDGLLTSHGEKWKRNRRLLTPAFHFESLKRYLDCINDAACVMMEQWSSDSDAEGNHCVEMFHDISIMSLDNLLRCIFSKTTGCQKGENSEYLTTVKCLTEEVVVRLRNPFYHPDFIYFNSPSGKRCKQYLKIAHTFTEKAIRERLALMRDSGNEYRDSSKYDFLDVLLQARDDSGKGLSHMEIRDELDTFVFEGHDTVTSGMSWAFYNLAVHQDLQEICRNEVFSVLGGKKRVQWEHIPRLEYLTKFIKESMRFYPPVAFVARKINGPMFFPRGFGSDQFNAGKDSKPTANASRTFPKNMRMSVNMFMLHRNPTIWENPDSFDPERFSSDNAAKRSPHSYLPFSSGPRNCIGQNFAMNEMKTVLALVLSKFKLSINEDKPKPEIEPHLIVRSKTGIHLKLEKLGKSPL